MNKFKKIKNAKLYLNNMQNYINLAKIEHFLRQNYIKE